MSTIYADNNPVQSLVEKKKRQWAREREELAGLNENSPWGSKDSSQVYDKQYMRSRYVSKYQKDNDLVRRDPNATPQRRPSLPPLYKNQSFTYTSNEKLDKEMGGETSGYGSDNPNQTPEHFPQTNWNNGGGPHLLGGYESSSSGREDRLKWGDRGVHVGKFWEPKEVETFGKNSDTPSWVKRGLERDTELVVSNTSPAESPEQDYIDRPSTSSTTTTQNTRSYIRGQNVPVDASELAEREKRRQIALAHQEAVRQQLEEREKRRQEEKARRIREEYEEEMRIAREQELERQRKEHQQRLWDEKLERERKRKEALREAIEIAEKEAREQKLKQKMMRQNFNMSENVIEVEKIKPVKLPPKQESNSEDDSTETDNNVIAIEDGDHINNKDNNKKEINYSYDTESTNNVLNQINNNNNNNNTNNNPTFVSQENLALVLQNPLESFQNAQFAVLIPALNTSATNTLPIAVPLPLYSDRSAVSTARTENRILTPTQYRNKKGLCDSSTQTDYVEFKQVDNREKYAREKLANLEISYEGRYKKERRSRSELRESVEERPKWGVNRPPTRYLKQSEKDPQYQRRKLRQKQRQSKVYGDKSPHSSDDSQTASPRTYRKRGYSEKRHARALWRKNEQLFAENVRVYQTEIVPLESDKDHIYFKTKPTHQCCCKCRNEREYTDKVKVIDILKIEHNTPRECHRYKSENDDKNKLPACNSSYINDSGEMMEKLNSIHHGLMLKQEHWDETPRHSLHYSPSRNP